MYWIPETLYAPMHQTIQQTEAAEEDFGIPCCGKRRILNQNIELEEIDKLNSQLKVHLMIKDKWDSSQKDEKIRRNLHK